jgi:hypothetical protein
MRDGITKNKLPEYPLDTTIQETPLGPYSFTSECECSMCQQLSGQKQLSDESYNAPISPEDIPTCDLNILNSGEKFVPTIFPSMFDPETEARKKRMLIYKEKRKKQNPLPVRYLKRSEQARKRPRLNGRFISTSPNTVIDLQDGSKQPGSAGINFKANQDQVTTAIKKTHPTTRVLSNAPTPFLSGN